MISIAVAYSKQQNWKLLHLNLTLRAVVLVFLKFLFYWVLRQLLPYVKQILITLFAKHLQLVSLESSSNCYINPTISAFVLGKIKHFVCKCVVFPKY